MLPPKLIVRFTVLVVVFYALLMIPWSGLERGYAGVFRAGGDALFSRFWFWPSGRVRFLDLQSPTLAEDLAAAIGHELPPHAKIAQPEGVKDTLMVLMKSHSGTIGQLRTGSRYIAYEPMAAVIALSLATPIVWRRRVWVLAWGLFWVHIFIALRLSLTLGGEFFNPAKKYALGHASPFWLDLLKRLEEVFSDNPTATLVVAMFIWLVAVVGLFGWSAWRSKPAASDERTTVAETTR
jgi:hypothetical protein